MALERMRMHLESAAVAGLPPILVNRMSEDIDSFAFYVYIHVFHILPIPRSLIHFFLLCIIFGTSREAT